MSDRNYDYVGRGQRLLENRIISEEATGIPILAYSFKKEDKNNAPYYTIGSQYIALQDSKLISGEDKKKDANEYFRICLNIFMFEKLYSNIQLFFILNVESEKIF